MARMICMFGVAIRGAESRPCVWDSHRVLYVSWNIRLLCPDTSAGLRVIRQTRTPTPEEDDLPDYGQQTKRILYRWVSA
jgi:hypothetical protein